MLQENQKMSNGVNEKHQFIIPAVIFVAVVGLMAVYGFIQAQTAWLRPTSAGEPTLQAPGDAWIQGGIAIGPGITPGAAGTITTTGAINTAGGVILNTAGATNGLIVQSGDVNLGPGYTTVGRMVANGDVSFNGPTGMTVANNAAVAGNLSVGNWISGDGLYSNFISNQLGSVGSPSYTFINDPNTGMYSPLADTIAFATNGVERMRIAANGSLTVSGNTNLRNTRLGWDNTGETWVGNDFRTSFYRPGFSTVNLSIEYSAPTERNSSGNNCYVWSEAKSFGVPGPGTYQIDFEQRVGNSSDYTWAYLTCDGRICSDDVYTNNNALNYNVYRSFSITNNTGFINGGEKLALNFKGAESTDGSSCVGSSNIYVRNVTLKGFRTEPVTVGTLMD